LGPFPQECPSPNLLAAPRFLRRIGDDLYIASDGVKIGVEARGIVIRSHITEGGDGIPRLGLPAHIAGDVSPDPDLRCGCSESSLSNYSAEEECAPADEVPLGNPSAVFLDAAGDVYFCDVNNQRIRKLVACNGEASKTRLVTFLGDSAEGREEAESFLGIDELAPAGGECSAAPLLRGFAPDDTPLLENATVARLARPTGIAFLDASTLLIADTNNDRVRLLHLRTGLITTIAGRPRSDAEAARCLTFGGDGGPATDALLNGPRAVAVFPPYRPRVRDESRFFCEDRRAIYVLDWQNGLVRKIDRDGMITTFAGSGLVGLESRTCNDILLPPGADTPNAGLGSAPADPRRVYIKLPRGLAVDSRGRVFIADCRQRILVVNPEGTQLRRVIGRGRDISVSSSDPDYYLDCEDAPRTPLQDIGDGGNPLDAILFNPGEMVFDADEENLYFADLGNNRIRRVGPYDRDTGTFSSGATIRTVAGNGAAREEAFSGSVNPIRAFHQPYGLDIDPRDDALYFSTEFGSRIYRLDLSSNPSANRVRRIAGGERNSSVGDGYDAGDVRLRAPTSLRLDAFGNIYTADSSNQRIRRFHPEPDGP